MTKPEAIGLRMLVALFLGAFPITAATVTLDAVDSGFYFASGIHAPSNENYIAGLFTTEHRNFLAFDLAPVSGTIRSATMRLFNPEVSQFLHGYDSPDPTETLNVYDVTTPAADILGNTAGVNGFADLGSGVLYGTRTVSVADNGIVIEIALNSSAIAAMNAAPGLFLLGGAIGTIDGPANQHVFGFSMASFVPDHTRELVLDIAEVPEPSSAVLAVVGILLVGVRVLFGRKAVEIS